MEVRIDHGLGVEEALRRLLKAALEHDIRIDQNQGGASGRLEKSAGFLGSVVGEYTLADDHLLILVSKAPAMIPEETVRRMIVDGLGSTFA